MKKKIYFFVRDDDVAVLDRKFLNFYNMMDNLKIPVIYGVIPCRLTKEMASFLKKECGRKKIFIAQHGFKHENYGKLKKYEFGLLRGYEQQKEDLKQGMKIMQENFGSCIKKGRMFIPPYNHMNRTTLQALSESGFGSVSVDLPRANLGGLRNFPALITLDEYTKEGIVKKNLNQLLLDFKNFSRKLGIFGIYVHHKNLEKNDLDNLEKFINLLKNANITFIP